MTEPHGGPAAPAPRSPGWVASLRPYVPQALALMLGVLALSNLLLWLQVQDLEKGPAVAVIGVREMTQGYLRKVATSEVTPEEAGIRAKAFLAVAEDEMSRMAPARGHLVLARECVLSGEAQDLTPELERVVEKTLSAATGGLSERIGPVSPLPSKLARP